MAHSDLYSLVHSLSQAEQRHFRLSAGTYKKQPDYIRVFDVLLGMDQWDADLLRKRIDAALRPRLPVLKHYLYDALLKALVNFQRQSSQELRVRNLLDEAEVLAMRGMEEPARKILKRVRREARKADAYPYLLICRKWEKKLLKGYSNEKIRTLFEEARAEELKELEKIQNESSILYEKDMILLDLQSGKTSTRKLSLKDMSRLIPSEKEALSFEGKFAGHLTWAFFHTRNKNVKLALPHFRRMVDLWEEDPERKIWFPERYGATLTDYLAACNMLMMYDDFEPFLKKLGEIRFYDTANRERFKINRLNLELIHLTNTDRLEKAEQIADEWNKELGNPTPGKTAPRVIAIWFNFALIYFFNQKFKKSLRKINDILAETNPQQRQDIRRFAFFLRCMIHLELGNEETLQREFSSLKKNLGAPSPSRFKSEIWSFFENWLKADTAGRLHAEKDFFRELHALRHKSESGEVGFHEAYVWIRSRVEGRSLVEILKQKRIEDNQEN